MSGKLKLLYVDNSKSKMASILRVCHANRFTMNTCTYRKYNHISNIFRHSVHLFDNVRMFDKITEVVDKILTKYLRENRESNINTTYKRPTLISNNYFHKNVKKSILKLGLIIIYNTIRQKFVCCMFKNNKIEPLNSLITKIEFICISR